LCHYIIRHRGWGIAHGSSFSPRSHRRPSYPSTLVASTSQALELTFRSSSLSSTQSGFRGWTKAHPYVGGSYGGGLLPPQGARQSNKADRLKPILTVGGVVPESNLIAPASSPSATFDRQVSLVALGLRILVILKGTACRATTKSTRKAGAWQAW